ncbi:MAG: hypothetical protein ASARMPREDX12_002334 [Alectoria sarmentosa]|nr:MAG: hypothetical protein ASARMPRED_007256 [Alectoria sarmentosa]CAD6586322.1 MAG: hypothetical protein ASARMPREDX12_002334 [Alectoria sarmentosa]
MPVKWTPETDQILLLKILETSDVSPKCPEISEKWPAGLERPTPRAISERIVKIRALAKASGTTTHFSISSAKSKVGTPRKTAATGITRKVTPKTTNGAKVAAGKRKRGGRMSDEEGSDDSEADGFNSAKNGSDASDDEMPKKKAKTNSTAKGKGKGKGKDKDTIKVEDEEEEENGAFHDSGYENPFVEDDNAEVTDYA